MHAIAIQHCLQAVKTALRERGIRYADLAAKLGVAEVTVKRMLNQTDISLERLLALTELAGLELPELLAAAKRAPRHHLFTARQDQAFANYPHLMAYFGELFYRGKTPEVIASENDLDDVSSYLYLRELENLELIRLSAGDQVQFLVEPPLGFASDSLVLKQQLVTAIQQTCEAVMTPKTAENNESRHFLSVKPLHLPTELYDKLLEELCACLDRFAKLSEQQPTQREPHPDVQVVIVSYPLTPEALVPIIRVRHTDFRS